MMRKEGELCGSGVPYCPGRTAGQTPKPPSLRTWQVCTECLINLHAVKKGVF